MANQLKMADVHSILHLHSLEWSNRRIADELGIDRATVARRLRALQKGSNAAIPPAGSADSNAATFPGVPARPGEGTDLAGPAVPAWGPNAAIPPTGSPIVGGVAETVASLADSTPSEPRVAPAARGRRSHCGAYRAVILVKLDQQLSAQRIFQDLRNEHGFQGGYDSVKRFVRCLGETRPLPMRRMEVAPGHEVQVDFGTGAWIVTAEGKRRRSHVFRLVLSHSRKGYSEATYRQTLDDFLRCLENAFWYFGGAPETVVIDNLRAAVHQPDWFDPEISPKLQSFCQHYGTVVLPTKPRTPRHKGKIENGIGYVKGNGLKGHTFESLEDENSHLLDWEETVADTRIHGTTRQHVRKQFEEVEKPALRPLPRERFPWFQEAQRKVNRDGHVEVVRAYYSVPPEYLSRTVWARWDARLVRIYNHRFEQIAVHVRHEKGRFSTHSQHVAAEKISGVERGAAWLLEKVSGIGPHSREWAEAMLHARGIEGTRVLQGLLGLPRRFSRLALEKACEIALSHQAWRLKTIRELAGRHADQQQPLPFLDEHPIIRPLDDYARVVAAALERSAASPRGFSRHGWAKEDQGQKEGPAPREAERGPADLLPPRSGYPSSSCSPAEPDCVSPDNTSLVYDSSPEQETDSHE